MCTSPRSANHRRRVGRSETELFVEPVGVFREEGPPEVAARPVVDHESHDPLAEVVASMGVEHEDVGEVGEGHPVRHRAREADLLTGVTAIGADDSPGTVELGVDVGTRALTPPIRLGRKPRPDDVALNASGFGVEFVLHPRIVQHPSPTAGLCAPAPPASLEGTNGDRMSGLLVAMTTGGLTLLAVALITAIAVPRMRRSRIDPHLDPELHRAGEEIQAQIDRGRSGLLR